MAVNFAQAARRHFDDCHSLAAQMRAGNTSQLAGLAAECALKAVLYGLGHLTLNAKGMPDDEKHRKHIDTIWGEFQAALSGREARMYTLHAINPFDKWSIHDRYEDDSAIDFATAEAHRTGAHMAMLVLDRARLEGDVR
jgi:hypothetical protein